MIDNDPVVKAMSMFKRIAHNPSIETRGEMIDTLNVKLTVAKELSREAKTINKDIDYLLHRLTNG